ncbi:MAG TPA: hypothetical protein VK973_12855, partial [Arenicellales bacterium]|nr:hypothetical protein [Arenicellales bacterium]
RGPGPMLMEAGVLSDAYPLRRLDAADGPLRHSRRLSRREFARIARLYKQYDGGAIDPGAPAAAGPGSPEAAARQLARCASAVEAEHGISVAGRHLEAAYALVQRRVEVLPHRVDRLIAAGLGAAVLSNSGLRVHIITDSDASTAHAGRWLQPVCQRLGMACALIDARSDESARSTAYRSHITVLSARELAMDFLRDAVHWPGRANAAGRDIDRIMGLRSQGRSILLRGLPCAVHLDIDSALIDNARTPIVLTRDAHPMHEAEELQRALELAARLQEGDHFELTGEGREVLFTEHGRRQIRAWGEQIGGLWSASHLADILLAVALVAMHVLKRDVHYQVANGAVEWLVQDRLAPGVEFYSREFVTRMLETLEECPVSTQREEAGRASYQQIFNRYVHLCGLCHSIDGIASELRRVYGLRRGFARRRDGAGARFGAARLTQSRNQQLDEAVSWARSAGNGSGIVVANSAGLLEALHEALAPVCPDLRALTGPVDNSLGDLLEPGVILLAPAAVMDYLLPLNPDRVTHPVRILVTERSPSRTADRRNLYWMQAQSFLDVDATLLLAADDALFEDAGTGAAAWLLRACPPRLAAAVLERRVRRIQRIHGREMRRMRRDLLVHETSMQGLLSFSGRGPYE